MRAFYGSQPPSQARPLQPIPEDRTEGVESSLAGEEPAVGEREGAHVIERDQLSA